jgi:CMP-N-acetylneuraminic acid synthetase
MNTLQEYTAFIFARGGSKGVKNKNIRTIGGKPLIAHTILTALKTSYIKDVMVSTDSETIAKTSREYGAKIIERPESLALDDSPELAAWKHAIECNREMLGEQGDVFISLPPTSPLRESTDIDAGIEKFNSSNYDLIVGVTPSKMNPQLTLVSIAQDGRIERVNPNNNVFRRQDVSPMYTIVGSVYISKADYLVNADTIINDNTGYVLIPETRAIDIDSEFDLYLADYLLRHPFRPNTQ